mgnify:CR=1 FL=1
MNYSSGEEIRVGDHVLIERGKTPGAIEHIVDSEHDKRSWNLDELGVLIRANPFGTVFWPIEEKDDPVVFVSRAE